MAALPAFLERLHARGDARALALGARLCRGALAPLAAHVERCFWALCPGVPGPAARRRGLLAMSAAALAAARALAAAADPGPDPAGAAALLGACAALLGERGALAADGGAFLKGCVRGLCAELRRLPAGPSLEPGLDPGQEPPDARAAAATEAAAAARAAAEGALAQCLHALFGVDMPQRDADWAGGWPARTPAAATAHPPAMHARRVRIVLPGSMIIMHMPCVEHACLMCAPCHVQKLLTVASKCICRVCRMACKGADGGEAPGARARRRARRRACRWRRPRTAGGPGTCCSPSWRRCRQTRGACRACKVRRWLRQVARFSSLISLLAVGFTA